MIWNLISIPLRSALSIALLSLTFFTGCLMIAFTFFAWLMTGVCVGFFAGPCKVCGEYKESWVP